MNRISLTVEGLRNLCLCLRQYSATSIELSTVCEKKRVAEGGFGEVNLKKLNMYGNVQIEQDFT